MKVINLFKTERKASYWLGKERNYVSTFTRTRMLLSGGSLN